MWWKCSKIDVITVAQFCEYTKTTDLDTFLQVHEISMYFIVLCHTNSNAFLYNYSNTAPLELFPSFVTCDFTKSFDSKTNIKFKWLTFRMHAIREKVIRWWLGLLISGNTLCWNVSSDTAVINLNFHKMRPEPKDNKGSFCSLSLL